ncbi:hypothetical protein V8C44DRAFT_123626 [Trichoderma aethiopicum]
MRGREWRWGNEKNHNYAVNANTLLNTLCILFLPYVCKARLSGQTNGLFFFSLLYYSFILSDRRRTPTYISPPKNNTNRERERRELHTGAFGRLLVICNIL